METNDLNQKKISLGKCTIYATNTPGIYSIDHVAKVAAVSPCVILAGEYNADKHNDLASLNQELLGVEVALLKEYVFGNTTAYRILDLSNVNLPTHMGGTRDSIWPEFN